MFFAYLHLNCSTSILKNTITLAKTLTSLHSTRTIRLTKDKLTCKVPSMVRGCLKRQDKQSLHYIDLKKLSSSGDFYISKGKPLVAAQMDLCISHF